MHFSAILASLVALSVTTVSAAVTMPRRDLKMMSSSSSKSGASGAVYFMTNEPDENWIIASTIKSDGSLSLERAVSTSGSGAHGVSSPIGADPLFSQGSVVTSTKAQVLAAVNAGSNTVSLFSIDPSCPTNIEPVGNPISSEGEFPISLAFNSDGSRLCVLNGGAVSGVICYTVDKKTGLKVVSNSLRSLSLNQTTPPSGPAGAASQILFTADDKQLLASVKGVPPTPGFIASWDVSDDGSLSTNVTSIAPPNGGVLPFSMTPIEGKNALLVTDPALGFDVFDLAGNASSAVTVSGQGAICWSSYSSKTGHYYLSDAGTSTVIEVAVDDSLKATVVKQYPQTAGSSTLDNSIATIKGNDYLYVLAANATSIDVLALKSAEGAKTLTTLDFAHPIKAAGLTINPLNLQGMATFVTV